MEMLAKLLILCTAVICVSGDNQKKTPAWCAQSIEAFIKCQVISRSFPGHVKCILGTGERDCYMKIAAGGADISAFDGGSIFDAGKQYGLKVIMSERLKSLAESGTKYFAVAVVKRSSSLTFDKLQGARSCHTGVQRSAGWILPVGRLLNSGKMACIDGDQYKSVANFFSASCAPGASSPKYNKGLYGVEKLCKLCSGDIGSRCARNSKEPYSGYLGAFQCLKDGAGDVAFIKQSILMALSSEEQQKYKILCDNGQVKDPKDYLSCNLAGSPAHGVLTRANASEEEIRMYQVLLENAVRKFEPKFGSKVSIFDGKLFSIYAIGLDRVPPSKRSYLGYLGNGYVRAIASLEGCI